MIRAATLDDVPGLAAVNRQVHQLHLAAMPARYRDPTDDEIAARFRDQLADPDVAVLVAGDGAVVGYVVVRRIDQPGHTFAHARRVAHVDQLGVDAAARRGGHGRALMAAVEAQARAWGAVTITLDVQPFNADAIRFYRALGYEVATYRMGRRLA